MACNDTNMGQIQTAQSNNMLSALVLLAFGIGHCAVIVGAGTLTKKVQNYFNWSSQSPALTLMKRVCGVLFILGGVYLLYIS